jgi:predicted DNA-binding protein (MmcQ/YjbR family)
MRRDAVISHCLSKPGAYLDNPWGEEDSVVKVGGKIFCFLGASEGAADGPGAISVKNTAELIDQWRTRYPDHIGLPRYLNKRLWNLVALGGRGAPKADEIRELVDDSYDLVVAGLPRSKRP